MSAEIFRFMTIRPPQALPSAAAGNVVDLSTTRSDLLGSLAQARKDGSRDGMEKIAKAFVENDASFIGSREKVDPKFLAFYDSLRAVGNAFRALQDDRRRLQMAGLLKRERSSANRPVGLCDSAPRRCHRFALQSAPEQIDEERDCGLRPPRLADHLPAPDAAPLLSRVTLVHIREGVGGVNVEPTSIRLNANGRRNRSCSSSRLGVVVRRPGIRFGCRFQPRGREVVQEPR